MNEPPAPSPPPQPPSWPAPSSAWPEPPPGPPAGGSLHPLSVGRALGAGWSLFRFRWAALLGAAAVFLVPAYGVSLLANLAFGERLLAWPDQLGGTPSLDELTVQLEAVGAVMVASMLVGLASTLAGAALVHIIGWTYGGGRPGAGEAIRRAISRVPSLLGGTLIATLVVIGLLIAGLTLAGVAVAIGGGGLAVFLALVAAVSVVAMLLFLTARWALFVPAVMLDGAGAIEGLGRSWRLVSGSTWRVLGYLLLLALIGGLAGLASGLVAAMLFGMGIDWRTFQPVWDPVATAGQVILSALALIALQPFLIAVMTLLYYDLRLKQGEVIGPPASPSSSAGQRSVADQ